ncbi:MAG: hypothetical protein CM1200mP29_11940 [Verrucomicrobiota bacterium]|nr:MAG: hypothetical protein CM1200mP29_11940 [Verrucomicrobiota bacterium]
MSLGLLKTRRVPDRYKSHCHRQTGCLVSGLGKKPKTPLSWLQQPQRNVLRERDNTATLPFLLTLERKSRALSLVPTPGITHDQIVVTSLSKTEKVHRFLFSLCFQSNSSTVPADGDDGPAALHHNRPLEQYRVMRMAGRIPPPCVRREAELMYSSSLVAGDCAPDLESLQ